MAELTADILTEVFIKLRNKLHNMQKKHDEQQAEIKNKMTQVESAMLYMCKSTGADSIKTPHGTIIKTVKTRYQTYDWASYHDFCDEHKCFDLLERRIHQGNLKSFLQDNPGVLPKGLNEDSKYSIVVRKAK